jgi:septal ring factor EnvC (AmiA/AmiB activator)
VGEVAGVGQAGLYLEIRRGKLTVNPAEWLAKP